MPPPDNPVERTSSDAAPPTVNRTSSPSSYLPAFHSLTSPVLDLASTLRINHHEDDVDTQNVAFLRNTFELPDEMSGVLPENNRSSERRTREGHTRPRSSSEEARERRMHEHRLEHMRQRQESLQAWSDRTIHRTRSSYGEGLPNHQSMFDWAPARDDEGEEVEEILADLTRQQPNTHPEILRVLARARVDSNREARNRPSSRSQLPNQTSTTHEPPGSLRSAAMLQNFRRSHRILTRSREYLNGLSTSERSGSNPQERTSTRGTDRRDESDPNRRHRGLSFNSTYATSGGSSRYELNRLAWQASQPTLESRGVAQNESVEALRRRYLENPSGSNKTSEFERIIKLLHVSRSSEGELERPLVLSENLLPPEKPNSWDNADCIRQHATCAPPATSWLTPGNLFVGTQQANPMSSSSATLYRLVQSQPRSVPLDPALNRAATFDASIPPWLRHLSTSELLSLYSAPNPPSLNSPLHDRWTVKVAIHNVDYETMTLQGTMEAFNVPSATPAPSTGSAISSTTTNKTTFSTYLEGEIIDLNNHTLLTEPDVFGVKTTPDIDAAYWRRLEPFAKLSDDEIARALLDRKWIEEQLMGQYVLMRWKERCFVKPTLTSANYSPPTSPSWQQGQSATSPHATAANTVPIGTRRNSNGPYRHFPAQLPPNRDSTTSFLPGADGHGYGLSISGFYYVSLRRSDGRLEGLYFDPQSSPYQHLEMEPRSGGWGNPAWEFR